MKEQETTSNRKTLRRLAKSVALFLNEDATVLGKDLNLRLVPRAAPASLVSGACLELHDDASWTWQETPQLST